MYISFRGTPKPAAALAQFAKVSAREGHAEKHAHTHTDTERERETHTHTRRY